ncbi:hypothetical protein BDA96_01G550900 [Sorghum bicolor]|uniref:Uncharacterized protein n=2 Tax=Sorghum bicolor TaxID=4558 RepID=A0A921S6S6_SORBI|nr:hypothetical protein BDA96_01G550900 [Sorghum bicolor]OQU93302.1 hypothetical protein SORBI_3001G515750 [Sorghum bicolor]
MRDAPCHVTMSSPTNGAWKLLRQSVIAAAAVPWKLRVLVRCAGAGAAHLQYIRLRDCIAAIAWRLARVVSGHCCQWPSTALLHVSPWLPGTGHRWCACVGIASREPQGVAGSGVRRKMARPTSVEKNALLDGIWGSGTGQVFIAHL